MSSQAPVPGPLAEPVDAIHASAQVVLEPERARALPPNGLGGLLRRAMVARQRRSGLLEQLGLVLSVAQGAPAPAGVEQLEHLIERIYLLDAEQAGTLDQLLELLDAVWRRSALGDGEYEAELLEKARAALMRYHARLGEEASEPVWFERPFSFRLGPHHVRGRVDRVDMLGEGSGEEYELIDYKTSRAKTAEQLQGDVQLSLYALAAAKPGGSLRRASPTTTCWTT